MQNMNEKAPFIEFFCVVYELSTLTPALKIQVYLQKDSTKSRLYLFAKKFRQQC